MPTSESVPVLSTDQEATMREFAALPDSERVTMTARDARTFLATLDAERAASAARIEALEGALREFVDADSLASYFARVTSEAHRG